MTGIMIHEIPLSTKMKRKSCTVDESRFICVPCKWEWSRFCGNCKRASGWVITIMGLRRNSIRTALDVGNRDKCYDKRFSHLQKGRVTTSGPCHCQSPRRQAVGYSASVTRIPGGQTIDDSDEKATGNEGQALNYNCHVRSFSDCSTVLHCHWFSVRSTVNNGKVKVKTGPRVLYRFQLL
jgi:hypothetical protein